MAAIALVGAAAMLALGCATQQPDGDTQEAAPSIDEMPRAVSAENDVPANCNVFGVADFVGASSLDDLVEKADVVLKGRITRRSYTYDTETRTGVHPYRRLVFHTVDVSDVLVGEVRSPTVTFGVSFREGCLDPGDDEYYLFLARNQDTGNPFTNNPAEFHLRRFGPQNVFAVESGVVRQLEGWRTRALEQFEGPEDSFRNAVLESAARLR
ncbi:MAG: hypothetical protein L0177_08040 [Chloroflexi bacterium]|nr:hypothetical protein [Chloroflexota bacterium]